MSLKCYVCKQEAAHFTECGGGAPICDDCVLAGKCCGEKHVDVPGIDALAIAQRNQVTVRVPLNSQIQ